MRWTDMSEKEMIKAWAEEERTDELAMQYLPMPDVTKESYWCNHDVDSEIEDYGFETLIELKQFLKQELREDFYEDLILPIAVATFKEKQIIQNTAKETEDVIVSNANQDGFTIPEFVYVF